MRSPRRSPPWGRSGPRAHRRGAELALEGNDFTATVARAGRGIDCGAEGALRGELLVFEAQAHHWRGETASSARAADEARTLLSPGSAPWAEAMSHAAVGHQR